MNLIYGESSTPRKVSASVDKGKQEVHQYAWISWVSTCHAGILRLYNSASIKTPIMYHIKEAAAAAAASPISFASAHSSSKRGQQITVHSTLVFRLCPPEYGAYLSSVCSVILKVHELVPPWRVNTWSSCITNIG